MSAEFTEIKIVGMGDAASRPDERKSAIVSVVFSLSSFPPSKWATYFNDMWNRHIYGSKRHAHVSDQTIVIECVPSEIESDHLPELKKIVSETNQAYLRVAAHRKSQEDEAVARDAATAQELKDVKSRLKFD